MKKYQLFKWAIILAATLSANSAVAWLPPCFFCFSFDSATDGGLAGEGTTATTTSIKTELERLQTEANQTLKGTLEELKNLDLTQTLFNKEEGQPNLASARTIEQSEIADITNEDSIVEAFRKLFLVYPEDILAKYPENQRAVKRAYEDKAIEFGNDAMIEMYITVRDLEARMEALKMEYDALSICYVQGGTADTSSCSGASSSEDELGVWSNYYKLNVIYDSMLKVTEELMALRAQYEVAQAVLSGIEPVEEDKKEDTENSEQETANQEEEQVSSNEVFHYLHSRQIAHAQMFSTKSTSERQAKLITKETSTAKATNTSVTNKTDTADADTDEDEGGVVQAEPYKISSPFAGTAEQFQASITANNVYQTLQKALQAHNLKQQLPEYRRVFVEYNKMKEQHEKALTQLMKSENCAINYLGKYYIDPVKVWYGDGCRSVAQKIVCDSNRTLTAETLKNLLPGDVLCENDKTKICSSYNLNDYSSREGFSGWLISAYKAAKSAKALSLNEEDLASPMTNTSIEPNVANIESLSAQYNAESAAGTMDSSLLNPSREETIEKNLREQNLISWQLGAEAARKISSDMASGSSEWGVLKASYPIWADEKLVYQQYLKEKYKNMRLYIQNLDLRPQTGELVQAINNILPASGTVDGINLLEIKNYNNSVLEKLLPLVYQDKSNTKVKFRAAKLQEDLEDELNDLKTSFYAEMTSLINRKDTFYEDYDSENKKLNEYKTKYNEQIGNKQQEESDIEGQKIVIEISQDRKAKSKDVMGNFEDNAESAINVSNEKATEAEQKSKTFLPGIEEQRGNIDSLKLELESLEESIARAKSNYAARASEAEAKGFAEIKTALSDNGNDAAAETLGSSDHLADILKSGGNMASRALLSAIINVADAATKEVRHQIISKINEASSKIAALDEDRFTQKGYDNIVAIHRKMLNDIKDVDINISINSTSLATFLTANAVKELAKEIIVSNIFAEICGNNVCYEEDSEYFVGANPQPHDFMAPKDLVTTPTPPLREIVHFDRNDFAEVLKSDTWMTMRDGVLAGFMATGQKLPEIWERILGGRGFVERDIDMEDILSYNQSTYDVLRQGAGYPCTTGKYDVYIRNGEYYVANATGEIKQFCKDIQTISLPLSQAVKIYFIDGRVSNGATKTPPEKELSSELATILAYDDGLTFNSYIKEIMEFYENYANGENVDESVQERDKLYRKELLMQNQFGDFLNFVENEMIYQDNVDKLDVEIGQTREKIKEQLSDIGYEPQEDFDLADDVTYNEIMNALDSTKNKYMEESVSQIDSIQPLNDVIEEKLTKINNIVGALQMDNEERVLLSDNMSGNSELSEKSKSKQVDAQVREKYEQEAQKAHEDNLANSEEPYCANYE